MAAQQPAPTRPGTDGQLQSIVKTSAFEQHAQTLITTIGAGLLLFTATSMSGMSREVAALTARFDAASTTHSVEAARRDAAMADLARTVAQHERALADLNARQVADERRAAIEDARRRPGHDGGAP